MANLLNICLYNEENESSKVLSDALRGLNFVRLIGEATTADQLADELSGGKVNLVFFHLDPSPKAVVEMITQVSTRYPEIALVAVSHQTSPDAILAPMRAGCDQFVCEPIDEKDLADAVYRVASKRLLRQPKSRCICVVGASGGAGTTSIACNLAVELAHITERECALMDLDLQFGNIALNFDDDPKYNIYDLASAAGTLDAAILDSTLTTTSCNVSLLARPTQMEQAELITPDVVQRVIELLVERCENIVIDVAHHLTPCIGAALLAADHVLIVCQLLVPSVRNAKRLYDALNGFGVPDDCIHIVLNRSDGRSSAGRVSVKDLEHAISRPIFAHVPNDYQFIARSIDFGRPIASVDSKNPIRTAIRGIAEQLLVDPSKSSTDDKKTRGLIGRLFSR